MRQDIVAEVVIKSYNNLNIPHLQFIDSSISHSLLLHLVIDNSIIQLK